MNSNTDLNDEHELEVTSEDNKDKGEFRFRRRHLYTTLLPLAFTAGLAAGFLFWGRSEGSGSSPPLPAANASESIPPTANAGETTPTTATAGEPFPRINVSPDDDPALGPEDAPIVMVEFSDFSCPFCRQFHMETFGPLMEAYAEKIRFVYRDFPVVGGGATGRVAAQAANCAGEQGAYWEFHDALFSGRYDLNQDGFVQYGQELNLDTNELLECIDSGRYREEIESDLRDGASLGVTGTPTFFINGIPLVGAQPLASFAQIIEAELSR